MSTLRRGDADLHYQDGTHRSTPPSTSGHQLALYEARITRHLAEHDLAAMKAALVAEQDHLASQIDDVLREHSQKGTP